MTAPSAPVLQALLAAAANVRDRAYAPYSRFRVGAAVLTPNGLMFTGCNVENASYPVGTCAEAGAIAAMVAGGERALSAILVLGDDEAGLAPCGACRQRIREFATRGATVHLANLTGIRRTVDASELLPFAFGPEALAGSSGS